ncbi:MBL fold metallo-hydrolase, partial [Streptomyces murinus]|uniref:MBL fold metallo-hydrolase n=3 Tax=Streptomyces TaxID=1883 RepID=UPI001ABFB149
DTFTAAGFDVRVHGELHAVIHPDIPRITNVGYLLDGGKIFHPGDALTVPDQPVETLMLPVMAPWNKIAEVIDYVREVRPQRAYDIHDALLTDLARPIYDHQIGALGGTDHQRLAPGTSARL